VPVAAIGDLDVRVRRSRARLLPLQRAPAVACRGNPIELVGEPVGAQPIEHVDLGKLPLDVGAVPFGEATDGGRARPAGVRGRARLEDGHNRLFLGRVNEGARVDNDEIGALGRSLSVATLREQIGQAV